MEKKMSNYNCNKYSFQMKEIPSGSADNVYSSAKKLGMSGGEQGRLPGYKPEEVFKKASK